MLKTISHLCDAQFLLKRLYGPCCIFLFALAAASFARAQDATFQKTDRGIELQIGIRNVELAVATPTAFRLSISYQGKATPSATTFLAPETKNDNTPWQVVQHDGLVGVSSSAGKLLIDSKTGKWTLEDANGGTIIPSSDIGQQVTVKVPILFQGPVAKEDAPASTAVPPANPGAPSTPPPPSSIQVPGLDLPVAWKTGSPIQVYGCGNGTGHLQQTKVDTHLGDGWAILPYYWSPNGYAALAVTANDDSPALWSADADQTGLTWHFPGTKADLYLMPAVNLKTASRAYAQLSGYAPVPPRFTLGYFQSRWGWTDRAYIEDTLKQFRTLHIPVDTFIIDFEWYTPKPDYSVPPEGEPGFNDFGFNPMLFPEPAAQLADYRKQGIHFVGIRKPRIGNSDTLNFLKQKGWMPDLPVGADGGYHKRDANFANADFRSWYAEQSLPLLQTGYISGWWNDEGEESFSNYYHWNQAELEAWAKVQPNQRFWSLNRAFSPGLLRLGAAAWTGDMHAKWDVFARTPTDLLNWSLGGMPYCGCDIGGYKADTTPEMLTRWMEAGVFFPVMRAHSAHKMVPHFPWLFGPDAQAAITKALDLRYRLIPYYYSLAYETHDTGVPMMRPLLMEFPDDPKVANLSDQWMMGSGLMTAPILQEKATSRSVYLPQDRWFPFEGTTAVEGNQTITANANLDETPLYVRAGTILPLGPVIQSTDEIPGGPLDMQIYPGKDATFTFVEDDGATTDYLKGTFRKTVFTWNDTTRELSWTREGNYSGPTVFKEMTISVFDPSGKKQAKASLDEKGSVKIPAN